MRKGHVFVRLLFLSLAFFALYLLVKSRAAEVHTVWEAMSPLFAPVFFGATLVLVFILFSSEEAAFKLVFVMLYSFIGVSFSMVIFPAGSLGSQQSILGVTRLIYDSVIFGGWGGSAENLPTRAFNWFAKPNFQSAYTIAFARMFGVDVFWIHLLLMPVLWGIFVPLIVFLIGRTLNLNDKVAALSGFLASAFPLFVFWGSISVPISLGYVFFSGTLLFCLRYLVSGKSRVLYLAVVLGFASFLSHFLAGALSLSFLVLAVAFRRYELEKVVSSLTAKIILIVSFVVASSVLPLALRYLQLVSPVYVFFGLDKLEGLTLADVVGMFLFGDYLNYSPLYAWIHVLGPLLGFAGMMYALYVSRRTDSLFGGRVLVIFLFFGFLVAFVDYRILNMFMVNVPFSPDRVWVFRNFTLLPFAAFVISGVFGFSNRLVSKVDVKSSGISSRRLLGVLLNVLILILLSVWVVASVFSAYPQYSPLQITSYELDAVRHLETVSNQDYVVIGDQFIDFAGGMLVGIHNPRAFYFSYTDAFGLELFNEMKENPSKDTMVRAMNYANVTLAYFVVAEPRLGESEFSHVVSEARTNGLDELSNVSFGAGKLVVFRYERSG